MNDCPLILAGTLILSSLWRDQFLTLPPCDPTGRAELHHFQGTDISPRSFLSRTEGRRKLNFGLSPGRFYLDDAGPPLYELWFAFRVGTGPFPDRG